MTACSAEDLKNVFDKESEQSDRDDSAFLKRQRQASVIIVSALIHESLLVAMTGGGDLDRMIEKLDDRYRSTSTASKISKIIELVSTRYMNMKKDIAKHIHEMTGIGEELKNMGMKLYTTLTVSMLMASVDVVELAPVAAAIKTLAESHLKWESVTGHVIEEWTHLKPDSVQAQVKVSHIVCTFCGRTGNERDYC